MKKVVIITALFFSILTAFGQESTVRPNTNKYIFSIAPQFAIEHAMRIDIEKRFLSGSSIVFAPRFYVKSADGWDNTNNGKMAGLGGEVFHKIRINDLSKVFRGYVMYGFLYNYYDVISTDVQWENTVSMGVNTQTAVESDRHNGIHKLGPNLAIGIEVEPIKRFIIETYVGVGARYSFMTYGDEDYINNQTGILDMGFTGITPLGVIKLGVVF